MPVKLRRFRTVGFRGARFEVPIDFTKSKRSIALFGDNASGKSTVTDAIEWFITGRIGHLWKEDCKESALRNVMISEADACEVEINFGEDGLRSTRSLGSNLSVSDSNDSVEFVELLDEISDERVLLRHADIAAFILKTKTSKRDEIEAIIGFDAIKKFREAIRLSRSRLENEQDYVGARRLKEEADSEIIDIAGELITTDEALMANINSIVSPFNIGFSVEDSNTLDQARQALKGKVADPKRAEAKLSYDALAKATQALGPRLEEISQSKASFETAYALLFQDKEAISKIRLEAFLNSGLEILNDKEFSGVGCPLCLTEQDQEKLKESIESRISEIAGVKQKFDAAKTQHAALLSAINGLRGQLSQIADAHKTCEAAQAFLVKAMKWSKAIDAAGEELRNKFVALDPITFESEIWKDFKEIAEASSKCTEEALEQSASLELTDEETSVLEAFESIGNLTKAYRDRVLNSIIVEAYQRQILSLDKIYSKFIQAQNTAMQKALDVISDDVAQFYGELHPIENVDNVRLRIVGEQGVEFEYTFHGELVYPPRKYLSESHLNSLGIVLFLASARLLNEHCRFLVLDDMVTSFDRGHRRRLLRLLKKHFSDWQIILLTHELFWFEMIKKELAPSGWLFKDVYFDEENGIRLARSPEDLRSLIEIKRGEYDVSNDLRKLLEAQLKEICNRLSVRVPFRFNDLNERRMTGELLSDLQRTINRRKCIQVKDHEIFGKLLASNLVATIGSHDNPEQISGGDIDVALEDIDGLVALFVCDECGRYVDAEQEVPGQNAISCACGKKQLDWTA